MKPFVVQLGFVLSLASVSAALLYVLLKKDNDDDEFDAKIYTARQTVIKMKIPKDLVGVLIGRGGTNIRSIQQQTKARVCFDRHEAAEDDFRECTIYGTAVDAQNAETLIHEFLLSQPKIETFEMVIHQNYCGRIIGRGGQNIRHITNTSHAKVVLTDDFGDERKIIVKGTSEQIAVAREMILETIKEHNASLEELRDTIQNRSPRIEPKPNLNGLAKLNSGDLHTEVLTPPGGSLDVFVSAIINPSQFWVQIINENGTKLDKLLDEMTEYYCQNDNQQLMKLNELIEGQTVAAVFPMDGKWYRAEIVSVSSSENKKQVKVFYVDYGDCKLVDEDQVMELRTDFLTLRRQAIECFLADIKPVEAIWSDEAIDSFEALSHLGQWEKQVVVNKTYDRRNIPPNNIEHTVYGVELYDTQENKWLNIGDELVEKGFAVRTDFVHTKDDHARGHLGEAVPELSDSGSDISGFYVES